MARKVCKWVEEIMSISLPQLSFSFQMRSHSVTHSQISWERTAINCINPLLSLALPCRSHSHHPPTH